MILRLIHYLDFFLKYFSFFGFVLNHEGEIRWLILINSFGVWKSGDFDL
jgi:hypothetical protein